MHFKSVREGRNRLHVKQCRGSALCSRAKAYFVGLLPHAPFMLRLCSFMLLHAPSCSFFALALLPRAPSLLSHAPPSASSCCLVAYSRYPVLQIQTMAAIQPAVDLRGANWLHHLPRCSLLFSSQSFFTSLSVCRKSSASKTRISFATS